jgi:hypothetical protein
VSWFNVKREKDLNFIDNNVIYYLRNIPLAGNGNNEWYFESKTRSKRSKPIGRPVGSHTLMS